MTYDEDYEYQQNFLKFLHIEHRLLEAQIELFNAEELLSFWSKYKDVDSDIKMKILEADTAMNHARINLNAVVMVAKQELVDDFDIVDMGFPLLNSIKEHMK